MKKFLDAWRRMKFRKMGGGEGIRLFKDLQNIFFQNFTLRNSSRLEGPAKHSKMCISMTLFIK